MFSISVETRAGVTRHHLDNAIDALAIVKDLQKETHLPIVITDRAAGRVLTVEDLRRLANFERAGARRTLGATGNRERIVESVTGLGNRDTRQGAQVSVRPPRAFVGKAEGPSLSRFWRPRGPCRLAKGSG